MRHGNTNGKSGQVWSRVNGLSAFALVYLAIETLIGLVGAKLVLPRMFPDMSASQLDARYGDGLLFLSVVVALVVALISQWRVIFDAEGAGDDRVQWLTGRRITLMALIISLTLFFLAQLVATAASAGMGSLVSSVGLRMPGQAGDTSDPSTSAIMLFYAFIFGPLAEEVVFRGVIMNGLRRFGRVFAIITSALLFGCMHGSFVQGLFGFLTGLVLGYVAMEYGLVWSLVLHIFNNGIYSGLLPRVMESVPAEIRIGVGVVILMVLLAGVIGMVVKARSLVEYCKSNRAHKGVYASWLTPWFLIFLAVCLVMAVVELIPGWA